MKKIFLSTLLMALPLLASAQIFDIAVENDDKVKIYYKYINNRTELEVTRYDGVDNYSGVVNIPREVTYMSRTMKVTSIGVSAFYECNLTSVTIPNSVTTIGGYAFYGCNYLTSVTIPNSVTTIGPYAFDGCTSLPSVTIPNSVTTIGSYAFSGCSSLTSVTIPNSVSNIGNCAFYRCSGLNTIKVASGNIVYDSRDNSNAIIETTTNKLIQGCMTTIIPNSVTTIGDYAFYQCSLTSITIPNSVTSIGNRAFEGCRSLTSVNIPNSVTSIGTYAFRDCSSLTSVTIPNSVFSIGNGTFWGCSGLTSVTIPNSITSIETNAFRDCSSLICVISKMENPCSINESCFPNDVFNNATLYVPKETKENYQSTDYWSKFVLIEEIYDICAIPIISYANKKLTFSCETEGVEFVYEIKDVDVKRGYDEVVELSATYNISVYATKHGLGDSDVATATLVWTNAQFSEDMGISTSAKAFAESIPVLISAQDGNLVVRSEQENQYVAAYSIDGKVLGSAKVNGGQAIIPTNLPKDEIVIVKVGNRSVKVKM